MQGAGEDHLGALGLETDDVAPLVGGACAVELDLPVDLGRLERGALDHARVVGGQLVLDGREVRHRAAHPDDDVGRGPSVQPVEIGRDRVERRAERLLVHDPVEPEPLREPDGADVHAEALVDVDRRGRT